MMAASSMMQLAPITMGPAMAKIVALGWTMVPELIVMSPLSSTSWQTTAFEWIVNLSRLNALLQKKIQKRYTFETHIGGIHSAYPIQ